MADVEFFGETFTLAPEVSEFALMEFAEASADGQDGDTMQGMASILRLIMECLAEPEPVVTINADGTEKTTTPPSNRARFRAVARKNKASAQDMVPVIQAAFAQAADLPTGRSADSSDGPPTTAQKSEPSAADKASQAFPGRPDLQLAVLHSQSA